MTSCGQDISVSCWKRYCSRIGSKGRQSRQLQSSAIISRCLCFLFSGCRKKYSPETMSGSDNNNNNNNNDDDDEHCHWKLVSVNQTIDEVENDGRSLLASRRVARRSNSSTVDKADNKKDEFENSERCAHADDQMCDGCLHTAENYGSANLQFSNPEGLYCSGTEDFVTISVTENRAPTTGTATTWARPITDDDSFNVEVLITLRKEHPAEMIGLTLCYATGHCGTRIYVRRVDEGTLAWRSGQIMRGDQIIAVNGVPLRTREQAVRMFNTGLCLLVLISRQLLVSDRTSYETSRRHHNSRKKNKKNKNGSYTGRTPVVVLDRLIHVDRELDPSQDEGHAYQLDGQQLAVCPSTSTVFNLEQYPDDSTAPDVAGENICLAGKGLSSDTPFAQGVRDFSCHRQLQQQENTFRRRSRSLSMVSKPKHNSSSSCAENIPTCINDFEMDEIYLKRLDHLSTSTLNLLADIYPHGKLTLLSSPGKKPFKRKSAHQISCFDRKTDLNCQAKLRVLPTKASIIFPKNNVCAKQGSIIDLKANHYTTDRTPVVMSKASKRRRAIRALVLRERERRINEERSLFTTDDEWLSEVKLGRYLSKAERKIQLEKIRQYKARQRFMIDCAKRNAITA